MKNIHFTSILGTFFLCLSLCCCNGGKSKEDLAFQKVKEFYESHGVFPNLTPSLYYNKLNHTLDNECKLSIPFLKVSIEYKLWVQRNTTIPVGSNFVKFDCPCSSDVVDLDICNCMQEQLENGQIDKISGASFQFKTKDDCYTFISLLADLKASIKN